MFLNKISVGDLVPYIPHKPPMVLLDFVEEYGDEHIICSTHSHYKKNNPLLIDDSLSSVNLIEYAAQAAAFHTVLMCLKYNKTIEGIASISGVKKAFLAIVRDFTFKDMDISKIESELLIYANNPKIGSNLLQYNIFAKLREEHIVNAQITLVVEG